MTNDGSTYAATFGYSSEDTQPSTIDVGDKNRFLPEPEGRGQTTRFEPGNVQKAFTVTGIPNGTALVWSVTSDQARSAEASAKFDLKCNPDPPPAELVPIGVFVTCVTNHASTYDAVFGYANDNRAEQIVPVGLSNTFAPAPGDRGQPTTFEPGTVRNAVTVKGIPNDSVLVWTVTVETARAAVASRAVLRRQHIRVLKIKAVAARFAHDVRVPQVALRGNAIRRLAVIRVARLPLRSFGGDLNRFDGPEIVRADGDAHRRVFSNCTRIRSLNQYKFRT